MEYLSRTEVARILSCSLMQAGRIMQKMPHLQWCDGGRILVERKELEKWCREHTIYPAPTKARKRA